MCVFIGSILPHIPRMKHTAKWDYLLYFKLLALTLKTRVSSSAAASFTRSAAAVERLCELTPSRGGGPELVAERRVLTLQLLQHLAHHLGACRVSPDIHVKLPPSPSAQSSRAHHYLGPRHDGERERVAVCGSRIYLHAHQLRPSTNGRVCLAMNNHE